MVKNYIWPLGNRISHILMIVFFAGAYITGDEDNLSGYHAAIGITFGFLILFRLFWGLIGTKYSKFKDFNFDLLQLKNYMLSVFSKKDKYIGHNPASSYAIVAMLISGLLLIFFGLLAYGVGENHGIFANLHNQYYRYSDYFNEIHEIFVNIFLAIAIVHVMGSLIDKFINNNDTIDSMISGYKYDQNSHGINTNLFQRVYQIIWIVAAITIFFYMLIDSSNMFTKSFNKPINYAKESPIYLNECASCHIAYPPYLLPKIYWKKMMGSLDNHFGEDASLDEKSKLDILDYLIKNSSENSTNIYGYKIAKSMDTNKTDIAISETKFWKAKHKHLDSRVFKSNEVKSKANCVACHKQIDNGLLEKDLITIPKVLEI